MPSCSLVVATLTSNFEAFLRTLSMSAHCVLPRAQVQIEITASAARQLSPVLLHLIEVYLCQFPQRFRKAILRI